MKKVLFLSVLLAVLLTACYLNDDVATDQVGLRVNGGRIESCVGPGVYTDMGFFADLREISAATVVFQVSDPEVATKDNQLVGVTITVQARRKPDCESLKNLATNWSAIIADDNLITTVSATAREGIKVGTRSFTLEELLNDRNGLSSKITDALKSDSEKYSVDIINVTIDNIALDSGYAAQLQEKALLTAKIETELRQQDLIRQTAANQQLEQQQRAEVLAAQLEAEKAQTDVQVEIANRAGEVIAAQNAVYLDNEPAYQLERLRLLQSILGDKAVMYFVPAGTDLTLLLSQTEAGQVIPLPAEGGKP